MKVGMRILISLNLVAALLVLLATYFASEANIVDVAMGFRVLEQRQVIDHEVLAREFPDWSYSPHLDFAQMAVGRSPYVKVLLGVPCTLGFLLNTFFLWRLLRREDRGKASRGFARGAEAHLESGIDGDGQ